MIRNNTTRVFPLGVFIAVLLTLLPGVVSAVIGSSAVKTWNSPVPDSMYEYVDPIVYEGTVEMPADWYGRVRIFRDMVALPEFEQYMDNRGLATTTYPFSVNTGTWTTGSHRAEIRFDGAKACRLVCGDSGSPTDVACRQALALTPDPNDDWCAQSTDNQALDQFYPYRTIQVGPPPHTILAVSPNPLNFWEHVRGSAPVSLTVEVTNSGAPGTTVSGTISPVSGGGIFSCWSGCSYSNLQPGDAPHVATIAFIPPVTNDDYTGTFSLTCEGCITPSTQLTVNGTTVDAPEPAVIELNPPEINFGTVRVNGGDAYYDLEIMNTGGAAAAGTIILPGAGEYTCEGGCDFAVNPGGNDYVRIIFAPMVAVNLDGIATVHSTSGGAADVPLSLRGEGADQPHLQVVSQDFGTLTDGASLNFADVRPVNVGVPQIFYFQVYNMGAGVMQMDTQWPVTMDGVFTCDEASTNDCGLVTGLDYYYTDGDMAVVAVHVFASDTDEHSITLQFRNRTPGSTQPPVNITLYVRANADPIPVLTGGGGITQCRMTFGNVLVGESALPIIPYWHWTDTCTITNAGLGLLPVNIPDFVHTAAGPYESGGSGQYECVSGPGLSCGSFNLGPSQSAQFRYRFTPIGGASMHHFDPLSPESGGPYGLAGFPYQDSIHFHSGGIMLSSHVSTESDPPYDFGIVNVGRSSDPKRYRVHLDVDGGRVSDTWSETLPGAMNYTVDSSAHFRCVSGCSGVLNPNNNTSMRMEVVFEPGTDTGIITEDVVINYDFGSWAFADPLSLATLTLTGQGNNDPILRVTSGNGIAGPGQTIVDFGATNLSSTVSRDVTIENTGVGTLIGNITAITAPFGCSTGCDNFSLDAGESITETLLFAPTAEGEVTQNRVIASNVGPNQLILRGTGRVEPVLCVSVPPAPCNDSPYINFDASDPPGNTEIGNIKSATFRVTNTGLATMTGSARLAVLSSHFIFPEQFFSLAAGEVRDFEVQFSPVIDGMPLSSVIEVVATNGSGVWGDSTDIILQGTGSFASLFDFRGTRPDFGAVVVKRYKEQAITIRNGGVRSFGTGTFDFPSGSPFTCISSSAGMDITTGQCLYNIGPNGEVTITVRFAPLVIGAVSVDMTLSSLPDYAIPISGISVPPQFKYIEN